MKKSHLAPLVLALYGCAASAASTQAPPATPEESAPAAATPVAAAPAPEGASATPAATPAEQSTTAIEGIAHHAMLTPPGYDLPENKNKRYPVVVVLHGSGDDELDASRIANQLGREGVIYVLPRAPYAQGDVHASKADQDSGFTAWPDYPAEWGQYESDKFPTDEIKKLQVPRMYKAPLSRTCSPRSAR
jgi:hypothetical protein